MFKVSFFPLMYSLAMQPQPAAIFSSELKINEYNNIKHCSLLESVGFVPDPNSLQFEGELYILATDQGYINQPDLVWEKLNEVRIETVGCLLLHNY